MLRNYGFASQVGGKNFGRLNRVGGVENTVFASQLAMGFESLREEKIRFSVLCR